MLICLAFPCMDFLKPWQFEGVNESHFSYLLDSEAMEKRHTKIKDCMRALLDEKAGLKTWLRSKAKEAFSLSPELKSCTGHGVSSRGH